MSSFSRLLISFPETNSFDRLINDYLNDADFLRKFYSFRPDFEGIKERIESYSNHRLNRVLLSEVLLKQYDSYSKESSIEKVRKNILSLLNRETFTVTTGHQLNVFGGPLYVIYKLVSTISLADNLNKQFPQNHFVPVYWMATEDHDIKEIESINLFGKNFSWKNEWKGPAGKMPLNGIETLLGDIKNVAGNSPFANEILSLFSAAYRETENLADATRKWVHTLLGKYGLVIIDGNEPLFKKSIQDILKDELVNNSSSHIITETINSLEENYTHQANSRDINLFYLQENNRERIIKENETYRVVNTEIKFQKEEIIDEVNKHPENFSPNVLMRPLYQECILPNIAFIGGPSEISYWLELKGLFEFHKVPMPVLFLRGCLMLLDKNTVNKLERLSIKKSDVFLPADDLIKKYILSKENHQHSFQNEILKITGEFVKLGEMVAQIEPTLKASVESESIKVTASIRSLEDKTLRALKKKNETEVNQIRKIKDKLFPGGKLQEREESFIQYYLQWGNEFIDVLIENIDPLEKKFIILEETAG